VWTSFLAASSAEWKGRVGATIEWPIGTGVSGNEGVVEQVAKTAGSIGYVELIYAIQHQLTYAAVQNATARFVRADLDSITAAAADARSGTQQLLFSTFDAKAKNAYPITTFTWLVVPEMNSNARQRAAVSRFLRWMLTTGQKQCSALGYAPLPRDVATEELRQVDALK
jgi:ABC-type phosphate transport system substrate-binding protein